jgi:hypothetical protein
MIVLPSVISKLEKNLAQKRVSQTLDENNDEYLALVEYEEITQDIDAFLSIRYLALHCIANSHNFYDNSGDQSEMLGILSHELSCLMPYEVVQGIHYLQVNYPFIYRSNTSAIDLYKERAAKSLARFPDDSRGHNKTQAKRNLVESRPQTSMNDHSEKIMLITSDKKSVSIERGFASPTNNNLASSSMYDYELIIVNQSVDEHEVKICTVSLSEIYERYPGDYFYSQAFGEYNRNKLRQEIDKKLLIEIAPMDLEEIIGEWIKKIKMNQVRTVVTRKLGIPREG